MNSNSLHISRREGQLFSFDVQNACASQCELGGCIEDALDVMSTVDFSIYCTNLRKEIYLL